MIHAVYPGWLRDDPTEGVRKLKRKADRLVRWEEEQIARFTDLHKPGSRAHLALSLLLHTGQRWSGIVRMGRQHIRRLC